MGFPADKFKDQEGLQFYLNEDNAPEEVCTFLAVRNFERCGETKPDVGTKQIIDQAQADFEGEIDWGILYGDATERAFARMDAASKFVSTSNVVDISEPLTRECEEDGAARRQADDVDDDTHWNDALIIGKEHPDMEVLLQMPFVGMIGKVDPDDARKNTADGSWTRTELSLAHWLEGWKKGHQHKNSTIASRDFGLTRWKYATKKGGDILMFADAANGSRKDGAVRAFQVIGLDVDSGTTIQSALDALEQQNVCALVYPSYRHLTTELELDHDAIVDKLRLSDSPSLEDVQTYLRNYHKDRYSDDFIDAVGIVEACRETTKKQLTTLKTPPQHKFRIFLFLWETVEVKSLGVTLAERKAAWAAKVLGAADMLGIEIDKSSCDVNRGVFLPQLPVGSDHPMYLVQGRPLRIDEIPVSETGKASGQKSKRRPDVVTDDGVDVSALYDRYGKRWMLADICEHSDITSTASVNNGGGKWHVPCPFADGHTDSTDKGSTCVWNAEDAQNGFAVVKCQHASCAERRAVDFVGAWIVSGELDTTILEDPAYMSPLDDDQIEAPYFRLTPGEQADLLKDAQESGINKDSSDADLKKHFKKLIRFSDNSAIAREIKRVAEFHPLGLRGLNPLVKEVRASARKQKKTTRTGNRPAKYLSNNFQEDCDEIFKIMIDQGDDPQIFHSNERLVDIQIDQNGNAYMRTIEKDRYKAKLENRMDFIVVNEDGTEHSVEAPPPKVNNSYHRPKDDYPPLHRVISAPVFPPDMSLIDKPGYHDSGVYYQPNEAALTLAGVSPCPTCDEVTEAVLLIADLIGDFCLDGVTRDVLIAAIMAGEDVPSFCHVLSSGLTPLSRAFIDGPTPGHFDRKDKPRTGATLLMSNFQYIATLSHVAATALPSEIAEIQKTLTAMADSGALAFLFDNLSPNVDAAELAMALTAWPFYGGRRLNVTEMIRVTIFATWLFTGNRTAFSEELTERMLLIVLDPKTSQPGKRPASSFKYPRFTDHVMQNAGKYLHALLTIVQNWVAQGCPEWEGDALGGFENHSYIIGGILEAAGVRGFLSNHTVLSEKVSGDAPEDALMDALIEAHHATPKGKDGTLFRACSGDDTTQIRIVDGERIDNPHARKRVLSITDILTAESIPLDKVGYAQTEDGGLFYPPKTKSAVASRIANLAGSEDGVGGIVREWGSDREEVEARQGRYILQRAYSDKHGVLYRLERLPLFSNG